MVLFSGWNVYVDAQTIRSPQSMLLTKIWSIVSVAVAASAVVEHVVAAAAVILTISVTYVST